LMEPVLEGAIPALGVTPEAFLHAISTVGADSLALAPPAKAMALLMCAFDDIDTFRALMRAEEAASADPVRRAALALQSDAAWQAAVQTYFEGNAHKFEAAARSPEGRAHSRLTWSALHEAYQLELELELEEALERIEPPIDAEKVLEGISSDVVAVPLAPEAILPLRAFADYAQFERMMLGLAQEVVQEDEDDELGI